jgi:hypothetical protein
MSAPQFRSREEMAAYVWDYVARRARMSIRFRKLRGCPTVRQVVTWDDGAWRYRIVRGGREDVMQGVINAAVLKLLTPAVDPIDVLSKPLQKKMLGPLPLGKPLGNVQLYFSPFDLPEWRAFVKWHNKRIELGKFWSVTGAERDALVDLEIRYAREAYINETRYYSPSADETIDQSKQENLSRLTEAGQELANDPVKLLTNQTQESAEANLIAAQRELRAKLEATEDAKLSRAGVEYYGKLPGKHRPVFHAICAGESVDATIAARCGVARATVARIRATLEGLADQFQTLPPYEVEGHASPVEIPIAPDAPQEESKLATQIADTEYEDALPEGTGEGALHLAESLHMPEIDGAADNTLHLSRRTDRVLGSWGYGPKMYYPACFTPDYHNFWNPARRAELDRFSDNRFSERERRTLAEESAAAGVNLPRTLGELNRFVDAREQAARDAQQAVNELSKRMKKVAKREQRTAEELAKLEDLRAFAVPLARELHHKGDLDALLIDSLELIPKIAEEDDAPSTGA